MLEVRHTPWLISLTANRNTPMPLNARLIEFKAHVNQVLTADRAVPAEKIEHFRLRLALVKATAERLPADKSNALFHVMWEELNEVLARFQEVASSLDSQPAPRNVPPFPHRRITGQN